MAFWSRPSSGTEEWPGSGPANRREPITGRHVDRALEVGGPATRFPPRETKTSLIGI